MESYPRDAVVRVPRFASRREGDEAIVSTPDADVLLCFPVEGLDVLDDLSRGLTVGQMADRYRDRHGEPPDIEDFLHALTDQGFPLEVVRHPAPSDAVAPVPAGAHDHGPTSPTGGRHRAVSFDGIPPAVARRLCGTPVLVGFALLVAVGVVAAGDDPGLLPGATALLFPNGHFAALTLATLLLALAAVFLHETAHAVVARSTGASSRLVLGNLMYTMVAQTEISSIWLAPRRTRYLAFLSGTVVDLVAASLLVDVLWAQRHGWIALQDTVVAPLLSAFLFTYGARISFQFLFYLRTDLYYVLSTALGCKNLMTDTEDLLRNLLARALRRPAHVDQSGIPRHELRGVRVYAAFYALGRTFWLGVLVFFYLPLLWGYSQQFVLLATGRPHRFGTLDFVVVAGLAFLIDGGGILMWVRGLRARRRAARGAAR
ncbi:MAG TPA: hypothetical protein VI248_24680 [Kineosporiaceae bacterium]